MYYVYIKAFKNYVCKDDKGYYFSDDANKVKFKDEKELLSAPVYILLTTPFQLEYQLIKAD